MVTRPSALPVDAGTISCTVTLSGAGEVTSIDALDFAPSLSVTVQIEVPGPTVASVSPAPVDGPDHAVVSGDFPPEISAWRPAVASPAHLMAWVCVTRTTSGRMFSGMVTDAV